MIYDDDIDILASRLNFDVIAFRGNTRNEMIIIALISLSVTVLLLSTLSKLLIGMLMIGVGISFPAAIPLGWGFATLMQKLKSGKPKGYVKQQFQLWLDHNGIKQSPFIKYSGYWSIHRD